MSESVRIASKLHPAGKLYALRTVAALTEAEQAELVALHRSAAALWARPRPGLRAKFRLSRAVDAAVRILLPDLEPAVLRRLLHAGQAVSVIQLDNPARPANEAQARELAPLLRRAARRCQLHRELRRTRPDRLA